MGAVQWEARPAASGRVVTVVYCVVVLLPLGLMLLGGVFWLMSLRPVHLVFALGAGLGAVLGPAFLLLLPVAVQATRNERLILDGHSLTVVNAQGRPARRVSRAAVSGVWTALLPPRRQTGSVPTFPRRVFVVAGAEGERPVFLTREYSPKDLVVLWRLIGREPVDLGRLSEAELARQIPGASYTTRDMFADLGVWGRVYVVAVAVLWVYVAVAFAVGTAG